MLSTILSVLLLILKIIGILLLVILGLILLILLVPIRYNFAVDAPEGQDLKEHLKAGAGVSWFLVLLRANLSLLGTKLSYEVKILGIPILGNDPEFLKKKEEKARKKAEKKEAKSKKEEEPESEASEPEVSDSTGAEPEATEAGKEETLIEYSPTRTPSEGEEDPGKKKKNKKKNKEKKGTPEDTTEKKKTSLSEKLESVKNKIGEVGSKIEEGKQFLDEYQVIRLVGIAKDAVIKLLKHIVPRRIKGWIRYGFNDPSTTGYAAAAAALFYPSYYRNFSLEPDFMTARFAGNCHGRGRIRLGYLVWILITLLLKKEVRKLIRFILK